MLIADKELNIMSLDQTSGWVKADSLGFSFPEPKVVAPEPEAPPSPAPPPPPSPTPPPAPTEAAEPTTQLVGEEEALRRQLEELRKQKAAMTPPAASGQDLDSQLQK